MFFKVEKAIQQHSENSTHLQPTETRRVIFYQNGMLRKPPRNETAAMRDDDISKAREI